MYNDQSDGVADVLNILGNETRRRILHLLSEEPRYFIQISRDLGISQQAILKHLELLEKFGLIGSYRAKSDLAAPARKYYHLNKSLYLSVGITNDNVKMEIRDIDHNKIKAKNSQGELMIDEEMEQQFEDNNDLNNLLNSSNVLLKKIDDKLNDIEQDKISLLRMKQNVMKKIHDSIRSNVDDVLDRAVLYSIVTSDLNLDVESLSEHFNVREKEIAIRLLSLKKRLNLPLEWF